MIDVIIGVFCYIIIFLIYNKINKKSLNIFFLVHHFKLIYEEAISAYSILILNSLYIYSVT